jgi:nucleotide-binding universal stress UspA family protein
MPSETEAADIKEIIMNWLPKTTIVVPVDFSGECVGAVETALQLVDKPSGVHVLHVMVPIETAVFSMGYGMIPTPVDEERREKAVRKHTDDYVKDNGLTGVTTAVRIGHPGEEIVEYARELEAELIVIPSHGYHGFKHLIMGSVAERVLRLADCPVLVLKRADAA